MKFVRERNDVVALMPEKTDVKIRGYFQRLGIKCEFFNTSLDTAPGITIWRKIRRRLSDQYCYFRIAQNLTGRGLTGKILHLDIPPWAAFALLFYLSLRTNVFVTLHIAIPRLTLPRRLLLKFKFRVLCLLPGFHLLVSNQEMFESLRGFVSSRFLRSVPIAYTGVDLLEIRETLSIPFDRSALCRQYGLPSDRLLVFSLGQLIARKGFYVLLDAIAALDVMKREMFFVWVGGGPLQAEIERKIEQLGLGHIVRILTPDDIGPERLDLLTLLRTADLFVHPSLSEGLPGALLEAMALGKACIASCVNAIPEVIKHGQTGLLFPAGDSTALAMAIVDLATDPIRRESLARTGQELVLSKFTEIAAARVTAASYDACTTPSLSGNPPHSACI